LDIESLVGFLVGDFAIPISFAICSRGFWMAFHIILAEESEVEIFECFVIEVITGSIAYKGVHSALRADGCHSPIVADPVLDVSGIDGVATENAGAFLAMEDLQVISNRMGEYLFEFRILVHVQSIA
jgi:hypothetical protein